MGGELAQQGVSGVTTRKPFAVCDVHAQSCAWFATDYSQVDRLNFWYASVDIAAEQSPGSPNRSTPIDRYRAIRRAVPVFGGEFEGYRGTSLVRKRPTP